MAITSSLCCSFIDMCVYCSLKHRGSEKTVRLPAGTYHTSHSLSLRRKPKITLQKIKKTPLLRNYLVRIFVRSNLVGRPTITHRSDDCTNHEYRGDMEKALRPMCDETWCLVNAVSASKVQRRYIYTNFVDDVRCHHDLHE